MPKLKFTHVMAKDLESGDRFKMSGNIYYVLQVRKNLYEEMIIHFVPYIGRPDESTLITPRNTKFKVYHR